MPWPDPSRPHWVKRFIFFHNKRHPADMAEPRRHHLDESLHVPYFPPFLRNSPAGKRYDIRTCQELLGHKDAKTTTVKEQPSWEDGSIR